MAEDEERFPYDPRAHAQEAVEQLEEETTRGAGDEEEEDVAAEDVTRNPDTGELEGLPGPSPDEPGESAG
jgi:hypothetical protein